MNQNGNGEGEGLGSTTGNAVKCSAAAKHRWRFRRIGGVDQVVFRNGTDIANLPLLDQKLWVALCMPARGIALDPRTADLLDTDNDGRIRPPELLAAVQWCVEAFVDPGCLMKVTDVVMLDDIRDPQILAGARRLLANLGKAAANSISLDDLSSQEKIFANTRFNGDGIVPADCAEDPTIATAITDILRVTDGRTDRSGKTGIDATGLQAFIQEASACLDWTRCGESDPAVFPLGSESTGVAAEAVRAVSAKVDDYFTRCRLAAFDVRATELLNGNVSAYQPFAGMDLSAASGETAALPLARIAPDAPLPLVSGVNPAWVAAIGRFSEKAAVPLLGRGVQTLTDAEWHCIQERLAAYEVWRQSKPVGKAITLGTARLQELLADPITEGIWRLLSKDSALREENAQFEKIEQMARFQRDLYEVLTNYVNFADFYGQTDAVFQAGTLYLDARACHLCIDVADAARHAALAGLSGAYLVYCDINRRDAPPRSIVAVMTDGDSHNLGLGRNGVFYDRDGRDWSASITRIVANPISVREAFWLPYRKLVRMIEDQITKRALAAEDASMARMADTAATVTTADRAAPPSPGSKKIELGTIALIGTAIGGISALVGGFLQALFGLGFWLPLGVLGIILLISGPSMLLAAIKLKQRNLGPILDANGWAVNTRARMNPAFGAALTELARLPPGTERTLDDPYKARRRPWRMAVLLLIFLGLVVYRFHDYF